MPGSPPRVKVGLIEYSLTQSIHIWFSQNQYFNILRLISIPTHLPTIKLAHKYLDISFCIIGPHTWVFVMYYMYVLLTIYMYVCSEVLSLSSVRFP